MTLALHERIRSDFESRILSGELSPGERIPTEQELVQHYGCARMTVNKALSALVAAGLIDRRKRAGSFVARPKVHSMVLDVPDIATLVEARGQSYRYVPLARTLREPDEALDQELTLAGGGGLLQADGLHLANDVPLGIEFRLVSVQAVPEIIAADFASLSPGSWLLQHVPWTEAETRISAVGALGDVAGHLATAEGTACLSVERWTWRGTERITYVQQLFLGDAYDMSAHFGPGSAHR